MANISRKTWERNVVEVIIFNGKNWLNEKHIETQLGHATIPAIVLQYSSELMKQRQELQSCGKNQRYRRFLEENFAKQIIMVCRTTSVMNFTTRLGFNQYASIMTQEQSILSKIVTVFAVEEIILQHNVLGYRIDAYFFKYKLAIEVDEQGHNDRDMDYKIERQKAIENEFVVNLLELIQLKKILILLLKLAKYKIALLS